MKKYYEQRNIGTAKYVINFYDGAKTYQDGSEMWDIRLFSNMKKRDAFIRQLKLEGHIYSSRITC